MCGISCLISNKANIDIKKNIKKMVRILSHRGPDHSDFWIYKNVALGHNRLSIIDLSKKGNQPFFSKNNNYVISYNGEIYNFKELKEELIQKGYIFISSTDTEVVLYSLVEWGVDALNKLNGMFAFIFYDILNEEILIGRDRYGIKPVYYIQTNDFFGVSSEQKALFCIDGYDKNLDCEALYEYFTFQNIFTNKTLDKKINILPPGYYIKLKTKKLTNEIELSQYWDFNFDTDNNINYNDAIEELDFLFEKAVKRQLISDVEISSYLSGGIDTGAIAKIARKNLNNLKSFTCGFDMKSASGIELTFDETEKARNISKLINTNHYELIINSLDMEKCIKDIVYHLEEPRIGQSYPNYLISKYASGYTKVILSGTGGDELFGGYPWRYFHSFNKNNFDEYIDEYYLYWQRLINNKKLKDLFLPINEDIKNIWTKDIFKDVFKKNKIKNNKKDLINQSLYFESKTFLHGLLVVEDKLSMAHSLETRVPFLDNDLVDFAMKCPPEYKINMNAEIPKYNENLLGNKKEIYFNKNKNGKLILREVLSKYLPKKITEMPKQGFSAPDSSWFKKENYNFINDTINNKNANIFNYFDYKVVKNLLNEHIEGIANRRLLIWSLLYFEHYLKVFR